MKKIMKHNQIFVLVLFEDEAWSKDIIKKKVASIGTNIFLLSWVQNIYSL